MIQRRRQLADLYNDEMDMWKAEVLARVETQEDRKARIMERAYALREAREKARLEQVKSAYDKQWRDACDDARTLDSEALVQLVTKERINQIQEKIARKQRLSAEEEQYNEAWKRQLEEIERRDKEKEAKHLAMEMEVAKGLKQQIQYTKQRKEEFLRHKREEEEEEIRQVREAMRAEEELQQQRHREAYERGREILQTNARVKLIEEEEARIRREQDAQLLRYALAQEKAAAEAEEAKRNENRRQAAVYKKYLEEQMIRDAEDTAYLDDMRKKEEEKVWKAREDALAARQQARDYLMKMVDEGRQEQIAHKKQQTIAEKEEEAKWVAKFKADHEEGLMMDRAEAARRRQIALDNAAELQRQLQERREKEERMKQEEYLAVKHMEHMEKLHKQKLAEQGGVARTFRPLKANNWYS